MAKFISSLSSLLALAVLSPRGAVWCVASARAMATLIRAYRKYARRRRSRRHLAAPVAGAWSTSVSTTKAIFLQETHNTAGTLGENGLGGGGGGGWVCGREGEGGGVGEGGRWWCRQDVTTKCLSMTPHEMHLIMRAVSPVDTTPSPVRVYRALKNPHSPCQSTATAGPTQFLHSEPLGTCCCTQRACNNQL